MYNEKDSRVEREVIFGSRAESNPLVQPRDYRLFFYERGSDQRWFGINDEMLDKHLLLLGGPGSGKTTVIRQILSQLRRENDPNDVFIVFDTKGDYLRSHYRPGDVVIGNGSACRNHGGYRRWNIYRELQESGEDWELAAKEMSASLFSDRKNQSQPFFTNSAQDVFSHLLIHFLRNHAHQPQWLNNRALVDTIQQEQVEFYQRIFSDPRNSEMRGLLSYFGKGTSTQALGVFGEMKSMVYSCFQGAFAEEGDFSIRRAVRERGGRAVFIEYDMNVGSSLTPLYRLLIDLALKETLGRSSQTQGRVWFLLDELKLLPHSMHLEDGLNLGRGLGCSVIAGMQSVEQIYELYGETGGQVICGGFSNVIAMHLSDYASRDYVRELFGRNLYTYWYRSERLGQRNPKEREGYVVEDWLMQSLGTGQAVVGLHGAEPFVFTFQGETGG